MPLPAALAARLAKRGIIAADEAPKKAAKSELEEEVFAEDYDDDGALVPPGTSEEPAKQQESEEKVDPPREEDMVVVEVSACPNKANPYHECIDFCTKRWGYKKYSEKEEDGRRRARMMRKYPLPEGWCEVGDPATGRCYYWNQMTDQVTWLAPHHPRSVIIYSSKQLAAVAASYGAELDLLEAGDKQDMEVDDDIVDKDFEEIEREVMQERRQREKRGREDGDRRKGRPRREREELDPMDPASYSDIPRGTWSTGLETRGTAKSGADSTASGPLFQQRPYPSPGAVLRANKELNTGSDSE